MRQIAVCSLVVIMLACNHMEKHLSASSSPQNTDLIQQNLKGRVKSFEASSMIIDTNGISKKDSSVFWNEFDEQGYKTVADTRDLNGKTKLSQVFTRYKDGHLKELVTKDGNGKLSNQWEFVIDSNGNYETVKGKEGSLVVAWRDLSENEHGQLTKATQYKPDGSVVSSFQNIFHGANPIENIVRDSTGNIARKSVIKLNEKGDPAEETNTNFINGRTVTEVTTWKYDSYDDQGNWIQCTISTNGKPAKMIKRKFDYYK